MMANNKDKEPHLDVYLAHSVLYNNGKKTVFHEGCQSENAKKRYSTIVSTLGSGYLDDIYRNCGGIDTSCLGEQLQEQLKQLVYGITSEVGRALTGLTFLQLAVKSIVPKQSIRLHKGSARTANFSWKEGISMRSIDSSYITPFLREKGLLNINNYGIMMTRSLAENYPYSRLYKAEMRGPFGTWIQIVEEVEAGMVDCKVALAFLMSLLINKSAKFEKIAEETMVLLHSLKNTNWDVVVKMLTEFFATTRYSARAFEVVIHSFLQAYSKLQYMDLEVVPLSQMRSANKKHGNVGDVELADGRMIVEAWDAKFGKSYLYEELDELRDKLEANPGVRLAGFITDDKIDLRAEIEEKIEEVGVITDTEIKLFTFKEWIEYYVSNIPKEEKDKLATEWLTAVVETFARKRLEEAPIDEPCEEWLLDLQKMLNQSA